MFMYCTTVGCTFYVSVIDITDLYVTCEKAVSFHSFLTLAVNGQVHAPVEEPPVSTEQKADGLY